MLSVYLMTIIDNQLSLVTSGSKYGHFLDNMQLQIQQFSYYLLIAFYIYLLPKDSVCQVSDPSNDTLLTKDSTDQLNNAEQQQIHTNTVLEMNDSQTQTVSGTSEEVTDSNQIISSSSHNEYGENYSHRYMHNSCLVCDNPQNDTDNKFKESRYHAARNPNEKTWMNFSSVDYCTFIICFEDPNLETKYRENIQETHVHELLSYLDFYRHPISPGDYVLVPQCITNFDQLKNSHKHHLVPYHVGKVLSGYESRSSFNKGFTLSDTPNTIEFIRHTNNNSISNRKFQLPFNIVIWIPNDLFEKKFLSRKIQWEFIPPTEESHSVNAKTSNTSSSDVNTTTSLVYNTQVHNTELMKSNKNLVRPFNQLAPFSIGGVNNKDNCNKEKGLNYAYTKDQLDQMKNEFIDSDYASILYLSLYGDTSDGVLTYKIKSLILLNYAFHNVKKIIKSTGGGRFLTEFGLCLPDGNPNSINTVECNSVLNAADRNFESWTY
ncbi:hypothetical protein MN116_001008 [Schistosoma mekongi]|uniref:Uncharacterized protein n=1 Tax=Schistosoma mekongi TaxID=38744 RepID=A0AAE1ZM13_SCHME|nr:hypothetical protein MN116_001008 [Schistosoma mekongi]